MVVVVVVEGRVVVVVVVVEEVVVVVVVVVGPRLAVSCFSGIPAWEYVVSRQKLGHSRSFPICHMPLRTHGIYNKLC